MNNEKLLKAFNQLDINNKRNKISDELIIIGELINTMEKNKGVPSNLKIKNYDQNNDSNMTEDEILSFFYEDIFNIENELLTMMSINNIGGNVNE
jgi:hypothetical protein